MRLAGIRLNFCRILTCVSNLPKRAQVKASVTSNDAECLRKSSSWNTIGRREVNRLVRVTIDACGLGKRTSLKDRLDTRGR